jgi:hypothetical protein
MGGHGQSKYATSQRIEKNTAQFRHKCQTNKNLLDLASIDPSDPFMGHLGICAYDLID